MVAKKILTVNGEAKYIRTDTEDKNGRWQGDNLYMKDGYFIIHDGNKHHIYYVKMNNKRSFWIVETRPKSGGNWANAGPYKFAKKSDFGSVGALKRNNPTHHVRLRKVRI